MAVYPASIAGLKGRAPFDIADDRDGGIVVDVEVALVGCRGWLPISLQGCIYDVPVIECGAGNPCA